MTLKSLSPTVAAGAPAMAGAGAVTLVTDVQVGDGPLVTGAVRPQLQPAEAGVDRPTAVHVLTHVHGPAAVLRHLPVAAPQHTNSYIHRRSSRNIVENLF